MENVFLSSVKLTVNENGLMLAKRVRPMANESLTSF